MLADIILIILVLLAVIAASIVDIRKREVPDWISYMLIASALLMRLLHSLQSSSWPYFLYGILGMAAMAAVGLLLFYAKQWGGGDAKLLIGIGAAWATPPYFISIPGYFLLYFLISLAVTGALYGLLYSLILLIRNFNAWKQSFLQLSSSKKTKSMVYVFCTLAIALAAIEFIFIANTRFKISLLAFLPFIIMYPLFYIILKAVENSSMYKIVPVARLTEGDWIAEPSIKRKFKIPSYGIEQKQIEQLKKSNVKQVKIKEGIPFVPSFFFAAILALNINSVWAFIF